MTMVAKELYLVLCSAFIFTAATEARFIPICIAKCEANFNLRTKQCDYLCTRMLEYLARSRSGEALVTETLSLDSDRSEDENGREKRDIRLLTGDNYWKWQWYSDAKRTGRRHSFFRIGRNGKGVGNTDYVPPHVKLMSSSHGDLNDQLGSTIEKLAYQLAIMDQNVHEQPSDESVDRPKAIIHVFPGIMEAPTVKRARQRSRFMRVGRDTSAQMTLMNVQNELQKRRSHFLQDRKSDGEIPLARKINSFSVAGWKDNEVNAFVDTSTNGKLLESFTAKDNVKSEQSKRRNRFLRVGRREEPPTRGVKENDKTFKKAPLSYKKRRNLFLRVGRMNIPEVLDTEKEKRRNRFLRVGRMEGEADNNQGLFEEKRRNRFLRVGRGNDRSEQEDENSDKRTSVDKRRSMFLRVGRGNDGGNLFYGKVNKDDEKKQNRFQTVGNGLSSSGMSTETEKRRNRFLRVGRQKESSILKLNQKRRNRFLRVGKATDSGLLNESPEPTRHEFAIVDSDENATAKQSGVGLWAISNDSNGSQLSRGQAATHVNAKEIDSDVKKGQSTKNGTGSNEIQNDVVQFTNMAKGTSGLVIDHAAAGNTKA